MNKVMLLAIIAVLLVGGCIYSPLPLSKDAVCGNSILENPPEACDVATNQGCSYGEFCRNDCKGCDAGVFCCTDNEELGSGGSRYFIAKPNEQQCVGLIEEPCYDLVSGNFSDAKVSFSTIDEARLGCLYGFACIDGYRVKLCGEDYQNVVNKNLYKIYSARAEVPCQPKPKEIEDIKEPSAENDIENLERNDMNNLEKLG